MRPFLQHIMSAGSYLTDEYFEKFIDSISKLDMYNRKERTSDVPILEYQLIFKLMYYCALGVGEVLKLRKSDFDLENGFVRIQNARTHLDKTTITLNIISELSTYLEKIENSAKLFNLSRQTINTITNKVAEKAKIPLFTVTIKGKSGIHPQFFRDSYRYNLIQKGANDNLADLKLRVTNDYDYRGFTIEHLKDFEAREYQRKFSEDELNKYCKWYETRFSLYESLSKYVEEIVKTILAHKSISVHGINSRPKDLKNYEEKLRGGTTFSPYDMQDFAGIRIICYSLSDVEKISEIMKKTFEVDQKRSRDRKEILGSTKMGYLSTNYVARLPESRYSHDERQMFKGKFFEIQLRTILQHAWDQISHDTIYKESDISIEVKRRFNLVSSLLEVADNEIRRTSQNKLIFENIINNLYLFS